jgi:choline dehydrogenase-like flavoprotein
MGRQQERRRGAARLATGAAAAAGHADHQLAPARQAVAQEAVAESPDLGAVDTDGAVFGYEGLYCFGSSLIPTSLGVNPSLTIAAVAERNAARLVARAGDLGLPARPAALRHRVPPQTIGDRVVP